MDRSSILQCSVWSNETKINIKEEPLDRDATSETKKVKMKEEPFSFDYNGIYSIPRDQEEVELLLDFCYRSSGALEAVEVFVCNYCSKISSSLNKLRGHIKRKHLERPLRIARKRKRKVEEFRLSSEQSLMCPYCDFSSKYRGNLKTHIIAKHTGEKPFACEYCTFRTCEGGNLKRHVRYKHTKERLHACPFCELTTTASNNLKRHIMRKHKVYTLTDFLNSTGRTKSSRNILSERKYSCCYCSFVSTSKRSITRHIGEKHLKEKRYQCEKCRFTTARSHSLRDHCLTKHSKEKPFCCYFCGYATGYKKCLKYHLQQQHSSGFCRSH